MLGPGWKAGCPGCSFLTDHVDGATLHLANHDVTFIAVSRAPLAEIEPSKSAWAGGSNGFRHSATTLTSTITVFKKDETWPQARSTTTTTSECFPLRKARAPVLSSRTKLGEIFHTYSTYGRGLDTSLGTYNMLEMTPKGRDGSSALVHPRALPP